MVKDTLGQEMLIVQLMGDAVLYKLFFFQRHCILYRSLLENTEQKELIYLPVAWGVL